MAPAAPAGPAAPSGPVLKPGLVGNPIVLDNNASLKRLRHRRRRLRPRLRRLDLRQGQRRAQGPPVRAAAGRQAVQGRRPDDHSPYAIRPVNLDGTEGFHYSRRHGDAGLAVLDRRVRERAAGRRDRDGHRSARADSCPAPPPRPPRRASAPCSTRRSGRTAASGSSPRSPSLTGVQVREGLSGPSSTCTPHSAWAGPAAVQPRHRRDRDPEGRRHLGPGRRRAASVTASSPASRRSRRHLDLGRVDGGLAATTSGIRMITSVDNASYHPDELVLERQRFRPPDPER